MPRLDNCIFSSTQLSTSPSTLLCLRTSSINMSFDTTDRDEDLAFRLLRTASRWRLAENAFEVPSSQQLNAVVSEDLYDACRTSVVGMSTSRPAHHILTSPQKARRTLMSDFDAVMLFLGNAREPELLQAIHKRQMRMKALPPVEYVILSTFSRFFQVPNHMTQLW